jgi:hypothetical protein
MMFRIIFKFYQIYSFPEFLKSETAEDFIYGLQPLSAGVGRKISSIAFIFLFQFWCFLGFPIYRPEKGGSV